MLHGVVVEADHGGPHEGPNIIKYFRLYINNAFLKDPTVINAMVPEITHTTDKKHNILNPISSPNCIPNLYT